MELFKYMPYRPGFFTNLLVRFTPLSEFSDPFEGQVKISSLQQEGLRANRYNGTCWVPLPEDDANLALQLSVTRKIVAANNLGIFSLTRSKHSLLMWAHYANHHKGIIVGFNCKHPFFNQDIPATQDPPENTSYLGKVFPVVYDRVRLDIEFSSDVTKSLLQKSDEWIYEKEYRMFMRRRDCDELGSDSDGNVLKNVNLFKVPELAITRIIFGERANKEAIILDFISALKGNPNLSHIKFEAAELHRELYHIEHIPVEVKA
ncbi:MAG: DUF2971 domain-containing protein [Desulfobacterales bacterium]|nr:DUF2971 domain-containing protein [Desulfobacterales bacterium]